MFVATLLERGIRFIKIYFNLGLFLFQVAGELS